MIPTRPTLAFALLAACTPVIAAASPIVVLNDGIHENLIISRGEYRIRIFQETLDIVLTPTPGDEPPNSIFVNFQMSSFDPDVVVGAIGGNWVPPFPPLPLQTPSIYVPGGLRLEGMTLGDSMSDFLRPQYDPEFGDTLVAFIVHGTGSTSDFNLYTFSDDPNNNIAYIGFANADVTMFGYMQIERVNLLDWKLIGYAYDPSGEGILVQNLVPAPSTLATLTLVPFAARRRRTGDVR